GMAGGGDLEFIAGQEVHGQAADFLAGVIRDGYCFVVLAFLSIDFFKPSIVFFPICKTGKTF
ncbi:hypothetical protein A256_27803, partial [Pseudomonas syringae pv. actinidiae ICMP 19103]